MGTNNNIQLLHHQQPSNFNAEISSDKWHAFIPVGSLHNIFESKRDSDLCHLWSKDKKCIVCLNKHPARSIIYEAFDLSNKSINCTHPLGFEERAVNRGRIVDWTHQHKVLKHPAIICFISHCGWNSVIELHTKCLKDSFSLASDENGLVFKEEVGSEVDELLKYRDIIRIAHSTALKRGSSFNKFANFLTGILFKEGHVIPLMELSYCLIERGFRITFINTEFNHKRIFAGSLLDEAKFIDGIHFVTIPDGLEPEEDRHNFGRLTTSLTTVVPKFFEEFMRNNAVKFTCFIADVNMAWALSIAKNMGLRTAVVWPSAAGALVTFLSIPKLIQDEVIDENGTPMKKEVIQLNPQMTPMDTSILPWCCLRDEYTQKIMFNYMIANSQATSNAEMIICNSFEMLEKPIFKEKPYILPVGPLHNSFESIRDPNLCHFWSEDKQCIAWLNKHPANSVIYVAFGSITIFNNKQFQELALGLELMNRPFLWVVRPDMTNKSINCTYPSGFEERVADRGRMVGWSPQQKVLKHPAIACFISHCGWNSTIEGVRNGVPFLCWPYFSDQLLNQRYITKVWKIGLSFVPDENGLISKEEFGSKVQYLLEDKDIMARSQALKNFSDISVMKGGSSIKNLNTFADFIRENI
ncbi:hypothetical protein IEQ34_009892 [Dendrobium chrysotoxum]|uniref:UDP-glycosyltransferase n=1 Tax=Dendrobium chrysotoxum TaxID=161865 RepID=A0AAV7H388_DENCH|nr:hypothetical protein IEQ34_009892 [Dendrobium chrysotoxum]